MLIVCDIDGTISDCRHREHLVPDWDAFHACMHQDGVHWVVLKTLRAFAHSKETELLFLTGRPEEWREVTERWLYEDCALALHDDYVDLLMRPSNDYRPDVELKPDLFYRWVERIGGGSGAVDDLDRSEILFLEDREKMVAKWRDCGFVCFQTAEGAF